MTRTEIVRKTWVLGLLLAVVASSVVSGLCIHPSCTSLPMDRGDWLFVGGAGPGNYSRIQDAIDNASTGDTVFVYPGMYYENIVIDTQGLTLTGEDKYTTTIHSTHIAEYTVRIQALEVTLQGFTIENATGSSTVWDASGVFLCSSDTVVQDNLIRGNQLGLCALNIAYDLTIGHNSFLDGGILFGNYQHTPTNPEVPLECFLHNVHNNTVNGKPLYYFKNGKDGTIPDDAGQVILANCTNMTIKDLYLTRCNFPITLNYCTNCIVERNTVEESYGEIMTMRSEHCTFQNNTVDTIIFGVCLDQKSNNNIVRFNTVTNSTGGVVVMIESKNNLVYGNSFHDNLLGIRLFQGAHDNKISGNSLQRNRIGLLLSDDPYNNSIENNIFVKNSLQVQSLGKTQNYYNNNYWNRPRMFPKLIFGWLQMGQVIPAVTVPYCITGVDWHPAREPLGIPGMT